jgi:extradiol dioxygenase family protein
MNNSKFHMSLPCKDIKSNRRFYKEELGFRIGRKSCNWFDVSVFGNQITFTLGDKSVFNKKNIHLKMSYCLLFILGSFWTMSLGRIYIKNLKRKISLQ